MADENKKLKAWLRKKLKNAIDERYSEREAKEKQISVGDVLPV
jgi:hypothetical protein